MAILSSFKWNLFDVMFAFFPPYGILWSQYKHNSCYALRVILFVFLSHSYTVLNCLTVVFVCKWCLERDPRKSATFSFLIHRTSYIVQFLFRWGCERKLHAKSGTIRSTIKLFASINISWLTGCVTVPNANIHIYR